ncbi:hypothetical protein DFH08DRAFT_811848 [Mycena albidolilacea]|uniref:Uncharacterized protein n=1 Tax=Mycena albidolilacea TaxID=1033008 RepID=A0AAD6ZUQ7_9AGAR|nr:hypothetical protein DFH08DRAFT_811848 [Mycena albidolilacea]
MSLPLCARAKWKWSWGRKRPILTTRALSALKASGPSQLLQGVLEDTEYLSRIGVDRVDPSRLGARGQTREDCDGERGHSRAWASFGSVGSRLLGTRKNLKKETKPHVTPVTRVSSHPPPPTTCRSSVLEATRQQAIYEPRRMPPHTY